MMASHVEQQPVGAGASGGVISGVYGGMSQRRPGELYFPCPADRLRRLRQALLYQSAFQEILQRRLRPSRDSGGTSGSGGWKSGGIPCARSAAAFSRPNAPTLPIAATPVAKRHTGRALRAMVSDQNDLSARIVTASKKQSGSRKRVLIR